MPQNTQKAATFDQLTLMAQAAKNYAESHGKIEAVKVNNETVTITNKTVNITVPTDLQDLTNTPGYQTQSQVETAINTRVSSLYRPGGAKSAAELTSDLLVAANEGKVYNLTTALTLTAANKDLFTENAEGSYPAGTNVEVFNAGTAETPSYKFDILAGYIDLTGYAQKVPSATAGNLAALNADGSVNDSGVAIATDTEVRSMLTEVFGADAVPDGND